MAYELEGTIKVIMDVMKFGSGFTKREFVVTVGDDKYPQDIKLEFVKDKVALLDRYQTGQQVKVVFDIKGGEHKERYYVNLQAWRIQLADGSDAGSSAPGGERQAGGERPWGGGGGAPRPQERRGGGNSGGGGGGGDRPDRGGRGGGGERDWEKGERGDRGGDRRGGGRPQGGGRQGGGEEDDYDF